MNTLTVYAYGNVDALHGIFNAIAMVMASGDFADMIQVALLIGFATVATLAALPGNLKKSWSWFLTVTVLSSILLVPKATVSIVDKLGQQPTAVVANVPWTLALLASVKSSIGATLTQMFETAFQTIPTASVALPAELSYLEHGVMFGSRLVRTTRDAEPLSLYAKGDLVQYIRNCIFPEQGRTANADAMEDSDDLRATYAGMNNPGLSSSYHDAGAGYVLVTAPCDTVWTKLQQGLNAAGAEAVKKAAMQQLPDLYKANAAAAIAKLDASIPAIYGKAALASAARTSSQIMIQNILINATAEASALYGASLNDPSTIMFSSMRMQAVQQMNAGNLVQGRIAEEALPIIRNITEAILYAVFPVLCILLVASEGKALAALFKSYVYVLIWVELWPPMFAIVNYLQTLEAAKALMGAAYLAGGGSGLTLGTATPIYSTAVSTLATSAWMVTFVPVIAAAVLFGMDKIMAITGATAGALRAAQSEAAQATKGNVQAGNVSFDQQQLAAYRSDPSMYRTEAVGGVEFRNVISGQALSQYRTAQTVAGLSDAATVTRGLATEASASVQTAERFGKAADTALDAAYSVALGAARGNSATASRSLGWDVSKVGSEGLGASDIKSRAQQIADAHRIGDVSAVENALQIGLGVGTPAGRPPERVKGEDIGGGKRVAMGEMVDSLMKLFPVRLGVDGRSTDREALEKSLSAGVSDLRQLGVQRKQDLVDQYRHAEAFEDARRSNAEVTRRVESSARESQSFRQSEQAELARSRQLSAKVEGAERYMREASVNWSNLLDQFARTKGMSVHEGIADPRKWQKLVTDFIEAGSVRTDTPDGKLMWIPPDPGLGPDASNPTIQRARDAAALGEGALQNSFDGSQPRGGEDAVRRAQREADALAAREQSRLGLKPEGTVAAPNLKEQVAGGLAKVGAAVTAAELATKESAGAARLKLDKRTSNVSDFHTPVGSDRNTALDGVRFAEKPFQEEASAESKRQEVVRSDLRKAADNIPTGPTSSPRKNP